MDIGRFFDHADNMDVLAYALYYAWHAETIICCRIL
jgi:hypothetical protein